MGLKEILFLYLEIYIVAFIHEMGHFTIAKIFKFKVISFTMGKRFLFINSIKFKFKNVEYEFGFPLFKCVVLVEFDEDDAIIKKILLSSGGIIINLITATIIYLFKLNDCTFFKDIYLISLLSLPANCLTEKSDGWEIIHYLKEILKSKNTNLKW